MIISTISTCKNCKWHGLFCCWCSCCLGIIFDDHAIYRNKLVTWIWILIVWVEIQGVASVNHVKLTKCSRRIWRTSMRECGRNWVFHSGHTIAQLQNTAINHICTMYTLLYCKANKHLFSWCFLPSFLSLSHTLSLAHSLRPVSQNFVRWIMTYWNYFYSLVNLLCLELNCTNHFQFSFTFTPRI